jgi:hypothetical protein
VYGVLPRPAPPLPSCPRCKSGARSIVRSEDQGDGSQLRKCICQRCGQPYRMILEPPDLSPEILPAGGIARAGNGTPGGP